MSVDGSTITITAGGTYVVSGALTDGEIVVAADGADVHLVLNGASITNADGPAIDVRDAGSAVLVLARAATTPWPTAPPTPTRARTRPPPPCSPPTPSPSPAPAR